MCLPTDLKKENSSKRTYFSGTTILLRGKLSWIQNTFSQREKDKKRYSQNKATLITGYNESASNIIRAWWEALVLSDCKQWKTHLSKQIAISAAEELTEVEKSWVQHNSVGRERICIWDLPRTALVKEVSQLSTLICWLSYHLSTAKKSSYLVLFYQI